MAKVCGDIQISQKYSKNLELRITFALEQAVTVLRGSVGRLYLYSFFILAARRGGRSKTNPGRVSPGKETRY